MNPGEVWKPRTTGWVEKLLPADGYIRTYDGQHQFFIHDQPWMWLAPSIAIPLYLLMVFVLPRFIKEEVQNLKPILAVWNFCLSLGSAIIFICWTSGLVAELISSNWSLHHVICMPHRELNYGINMICATLFAISKYFELVDTLFLIIRKRPVSFLHWYHHTTVLAYTWYAVVCAVSTGNIFGSINAGVHTIMYYYYFLTSIGQRPKWGSWVTRLQLGQMVVGLVVAALWSYYHILNPATCCLIKAKGIPSNDEVFLISSLLLYGTYFILFLRLYFEKSALGKPPAEVKERRTEE